MLTIIESPLFTSFWPDYWSAEEHGEFAAYLAGNPEAGGLDPRLWRMSQDPMGPVWHGQARRGTRHLHRPSQTGTVILLTIYSKSAKDNIPSHVLRQIAEELDHD